jgi:dTDP-4-dehydrorhamnose reductase
MRITVIGAGGQLAHDLLPLLQAETAALTHADIELASADSIARALDATQPDVVINTAAYNQVDKAEDEPDEAFRVNALGVRKLAEACARRECKLVHLSSDYVFGLDRSRRQPYRESDCPGPVSAYGLSKLAGELFVRSICPTHLVVRTCGLYGLAGSRGKGGNFIKTMLRLARERTTAGGAANLPPIRVVNDQACTPSFTRHVARAVAFLSTKVAFHSSKFGHVITVELTMREASIIRPTQQAAIQAIHSEQGIFHVTNSGSCTWYELACEVFRIRGIRVPVVPISSAEFGARAERPAYSVLDCSRYHALGGPPMLDWRDAVVEYLAEEPDG